MIGWIWGLAFLAFAVVILMACWQWRTPHEE